jgi:hypothetical protein
MVATGLRMKGAETVMDSGDLLVGSLSVTLVGRFGGINKPQTAESAKVPRFGSGDGSGRGGVPLYWWAVCGLH